MELSTSSWVVMAIAAMVVGVSKTGFPGAGILAIVLAAGAAGGMDSTGLILPLLIVGDLFAVFYYRRHAVWRHLLSLLPAALAGLLIGYGLMMWFKQARPFPQSYYSMVIGVIVLAMLGVNFWRGRYNTDNPDIPRGWWFSVTMGLLAGVTTMMANAAGPVMVVYLTAMKLSKHEFIGTGAWYFLAINCLKVPLQLSLANITAATLLNDLCLVPAIVAGTLLGVAMFRRISQQSFSVVVQTLAVIAAVKLVLTPWW